MKKADFHALLRQHIPQIHHLEADSSENAEAECALWQRDDCTLLIDFAEKSSNCHTLVHTLQTISQQIAHIHAHRDDITQIIAAQSAKHSVVEVFVLYISIWVEEADAVFCDFAVSAPQWHNEVAAFSLDEQNQFVFEGFEAAF